jgi:metal-sulfur cluster biosynthetic enzyme
MLCAYRPLPTAACGRAQIEAQAPSPSAPQAGSFPYEGPEDLRQPLTDALKRVVDPELAMNIVDLGLVYGVSVSEARCHLRLTMTSAACPVAGVVAEEAEHELKRVLPGRPTIDIELVWEPPWSPERMSEHARSLMGW